LSFKFALLLLKFALLSFEFVHPCSNCMEMTIINTRMQITFNVQISNKRLTLELRAYAVYALLAIFFGVPPMTAAPAETGKKFMGLGWPLIWSFPSLRMLRAALKSL
jgi:hypothetical protein